jgi:polyisoprenoid-binding protein YceI
MRVRSIVFTAALVLSSALVSAQSYAVDAVHSSIAFAIQHNNANKVHGLFTGAAGSVEISDAGPSLSVSVPVGAVSTGNPKRDEHLRSNDYFAAGQFPTMTFKSTSAEKLADGKWKVVGELTLRGKTKPVTVELSVTPEVTGRGGAKVRGVETTFTIKRSDFGMTSGAPAIADEVEVTVSLQVAAK